MSLIISGVFDGPLTGGIPKLVELTALADIPDLSIYGLESANNGAIPAGAEFTFPAGAASAGDVIHVAFGEDAFASYFGFAPAYISDTVNVNGDDAILLYQSGAVVDVFGAPGTDGTGEPWEYMDGWAYRVDGSAPSASFEPAQWSFSGTDATDGETTNATAASPFPLGSFSATTSPQAPILSEIVVSTPDTDYEFVEITGAPGTDLTGLTFIEIDRFGVIDDVVALSGPIGANGSYLLASPAAEAQYAVTGDQAIPNDLLTNNTSTYLLVSGFTGADGDDLDTDDDGTLDATPYGALLDGLGLREAAGEAAYADVVLGPDGGFLPAGAFRDASGGWQTHAFASVGTDATRTPAGQPPSVVLNEIAVNTTGVDWEFVELAGDAGASLDGVALVQIDGGGVVRSVIDFSGGSIGETGYYLAASSQAQETFALAPDLAIANNSFTNVSSSYLLVSGAEGVAQNQDLDTDDDGTLDLTPWGGVTDSVAVVGADAPLVYAAATVGPDGSNLAAGAARAPELTGDFRATSFSDSADYSPTSGTIPAEPEFVLISEVQGNEATWGEQFGRTDATPFFGAMVAVTAVVVGDFQNGDADDSRNFGGFYLQEEDADADGDASTSEGIFVFEGSSMLVDVQVGHKVTVMGTAAEYFGETQISLTGITIESSGNPLPTAAEITFPVAGVIENPDGQLIADLEAFEGMRVAIPQQMTVADLFDYGRFGELGLYADGRLETYTQSNLPDADGFAAYVEAAVRNTVTLDDGLSAQNPDPLPYPDGAFDAGDDLTSGDTVSDLVGVVRYSRSSGGSGDENYRINPTEAPSFENTNPREDSPPEVGGSLKVASFNVLNYFNGDGMGGGFPTARGANTYEEFLRQQDRIVAAITELDADVLGLIEIENDGYGETSAIASLTDAINASLGAEVYGYVDPGVDQLGTDAIAVGFLYKTGTVGLVGDAAILDKTVDARFDSDNMRPSLAQTFVELDSGEAFTTVVNHLKSKGSAATDLPGDQDQGDGAGASNYTRTQAAAALADWTAADPTGSGETDVLLIGDLNAYAMEDPIRTLLAGSDGVDGTADDLVRLSTDYSYGFPVDLGLAGQVQSFGSLDYAIATQSLAAQVSGTETWHINADEAGLIDYNTEFKPANPDLYAPDPFRSSDHDPVLVGLDLGLGGAPVAEDDRFEVDEEAVLAASVATNDSDPEGDPLSYTLLSGPAEGHLVFNPDGSFTYEADADLFDLATPGTVIEQTFTYGVSDGTAGDTATATIAVTILDEGETVSAGNGKDQVTGTDGGEDKLFGGNGKDTLVGQDGADFLDGGRGNDILTGGEGADQFFFTRGSGRDTVMDFEIGLDTLVVDGSLMADTFAEVGLSAASGGTVADLGGASVLLAGIDAELLTSESFLFA